MACVVARLFGRAAWRLRMRNSGYVIIGADVTVLFASFESEDEDCELVLLAVAFVCRVADEVEEPRSLETYEMVSWICAFCA